MKHNDIPFDIDPELSETADRGEVGSGGKADCAKKIWPVSTSYTQGFGLQRANAQASHSAR